MATAPPTLFTLSLLSLGTSLQSLGGVTLTSVACAPLAGSGKSTSGLTAEDRMSSGYAVLQGGADQGSPTVASSDAGASARSTRMMAPTTPNGASPSVGRSSHVPHTLGELSPQWHSC